MQPDDLRRGAGNAGVSSEGGRPATQGHRLALLALLNRGVYPLRRAIGEAGIISVQDERRLEPAAVACDVVAFEDAIGAGELERAIGLDTGPLLDGFHLPGASEFEHWADGERDRLRRLYARGLESLAETAEERREGAAR